MFRAIFYLLVGIFLITIIRMIVGVITKGFSELMHGSQAPAAEPRTPIAGELHRDPICGTFTAETAAVKLKSGNEIVYFCSEECRDRFVNGARKG